MEQPMESIALDNEPPSIRQARDFVSRVLARHGVETWQAVLVTSELASNVVAHARTPYSVGVEVSSDEVRIEVQDGAAAAKIAKDLSRSAGGYGLRVVESLARDWGVESVPDGKLVWVSLPRRSEEASPSAT